MIYITGSTGPTGYLGPTGARSNLSYTNFPIGAVMLWGGTSLPTSQWAWCDGGQLPISTYGSLYGIISTNYNTGGETVGNFRLPNLLDRIPKGRATMTSATLTTNARANATGSESAHTHNAADGNATNSPGSNAWSVALSANPNSNSDGDHQHNGNTFDHGANYDIGGHFANVTHRNGTTGNNGAIHSNYAHTHNGAVGANAAYAILTYSNYSGGHTHNTNEWGANYSRGVTAAGTSHSHSTGAHSQSVNYIIRVL